jgi:hypothetical protein
LRWHSFTSITGLLENPSYFVDQSQDIKHILVLYVNENPQSSPIIAGFAAFFNGKPMTTRKRDGLLGGCPVLVEVQFERQFALGFDTARDG